MAAKTKTANPSRPAKAALPRLTQHEVMATLQAAGAEATRKTYQRHGAREPLFGVAFSLLKTLQKRIGVDHELACALWATTNFDARNLAVKVVDPAQMSQADLHQWAHDTHVQMVSGYVAHLAVETAHAHACAAAWLDPAAGAVRSLGWKLVSAMALCDETTADAWFEAQVAAIEAQVHTAPNVERGSMNNALIAIGCRNPALRALATAAALRLGPIAVDHGDTACETVEIAPRIDKTWAYSTAKGFASPAAHERSRESMRIRC